MNESIDHLHPYCWQVDLLAKQSPMFLCSSLPDAAKPLGSPQGEAEGPTTRGSHEIPNPGWGVTLKPY